MRINSYSKGVPTKIPNTIEDAIKALKNDKPIILVDAHDRENEGDLVFAAETISSEQIAFMLRHCSGIICLSISPDHAAKLDLPLMVPLDTNSSRYRTAFTVTIEANDGVTTGVSAADRCRTIHVAMDPSAQASDLARPGHVFPLIANAEGVLGRPGHTEGSFDLTRLAGKRPGAVLCELMNEDGTMSNYTQLEQFAERFSIPLVSIEALIEYRQHEMNAHV